jgi:hypothetical protein
MLAALAVCALFTLGVVVWLARDREPNVARATSDAQPATSAAAPSAPIANASAVGEVPRGEREAVPTPPQFVAQPPSKVIRTSDCVIRGHVFADAREQPPITVELFTLSGGIPGDASVESTSADKSGEFVFRPEIYGGFVVVALADGHAPATVRTTFEPHSEVILAPITLERGATIYGEVRKSGQRVGAGVQVSARLLVDRGDDAVHRASGTNMFWSRGQFEWARREATTDAAGQFAFGGLAASEYSLSVAKLDGATLEMIDIARTSAPASEVVLDVSMSTVKLHFFQGNTAARDFSFTVRPIVERVTGDYVWLTADGEGNASLNVMPNSKLQVGVRVMRWSSNSSAQIVGEGNTREVVSGPAGSVIDVRIDVPDPDLSSSNIHIRER